MGMERRLAAIFSTDVQGYSRLMGDDEAATVRTITAYRELMTSLIQQHRGRVVDSPGDNLLAEFPSVVEAVQCAVAIQRELKTRNAELPPQRRMEFRIGINLGDVIVEGERIYGDGVNIAARLEGLAEAGGLCISGTVYDQVKTKLSLDYEELSTQAVKNIAEPVRVYRVHLEPRTATPAVRRPKRLMATAWHKVALAVVGLGLILGGGVTVWHLTFRRPAPAGVLPAARAAMAEVLRLVPEASYEGAKRTTPYKDQAVFERQQAAQSVAVPPPGVVLAKPTGPPTPPQAVGPLVIHALLVIDGTGRAPIVDAVIVVEGGKITAIGPAGAITTPRGATRLEVPGKTVIPGLIDMSVESYADWMHPLFLRHGVTTVRDVSDNLDVVLIQRRRSQKPAQQRPRIFACGPVIDGPNSALGPWRTRAVATAEEARMVARELLARQVDCLKLAGQLTPPQVQAIVEEAAAHGVPVTAQLMATTAAEAVALGVTGLERCCSGATAAVTTQQLQALARLLAAKGVFVVPTLVNNEQLSRLLDPALRQDPLLQHVPLAWFGWWDAPYGVGQWTEADSTRNRDFLSRKKVLIEEFAKANGRVVAGSATPHPYVLPGAGLQRELELLVEAGLTPMQAISAATRVAAEFLGQEAHLGTLEVGKQADLVILGGNPLTDIRQVRQVEIVLRDGQTVWKK